MIRRWKPIRSPRMAQGFLAAALTTAISNAASADLISLYADAYVVEEGGQQFSVIDLYADLPSTIWQVASVAGDVSLLSLLGESTWFHDDAAGACPSGGTWLPVGSTTHPLADSFVTIGSPLFGLPNATLLAPTFIDDPACSAFLGTNAGWFNSNPPGFQGYAIDITLHDGSQLLSATMLGRFSIAGLPPGGAALRLESFGVAFHPASAPPLFVTFDQVTFSYVPTPGTVCVGGLYALRCGRRRRRT